MGERLTIRRNLVAEIEPKKSGKQRRNCPFFRIGEELMRFGGLTQRWLGQS